MRDFYFPNLWGTRFAYSLGYPFRILKHRLSKFGVPVSNTNWGLWGTRFAYGQKATSANNYRGPEHFSRFAILLTVINSLVRSVKNSFDFTAAQNRGCWKSDRPFRASPTWNKPMPVKLP